MAFKEKLLAEWIHNNLLESSKDVGIKVDSKNDADLDMTSIENQRLMYQMAENIINLFEGK